MMNTKLVISQQKYFKPMNDKHDVKWYTVTLGGDKMVRVYAYSAETNRKYNLAKNRKFNSAGTVLYNENRKMKEHLRNVLAVTFTPKMLTDMSYFDSKDDQTFFTQNVVSLLVDAATDLFDDDTCDGAANIFASLKHIGWTLEEDIVVKNEKLLEDFLLNLWKEHKGQGSLDDVHAFIDEHASDTYTFVGILDSHYVKSGSGTKRKANLLSQFNDYTQKQDQLNNKKQKIIALMVKNIHKDATYYNLLPESVQNEEEIETAFNVSKTRSVEKMKERQQNLLDELKQVQEKVKLLSN